MSRHSSRLIAIASAVARLVLSGTRVLLDSVPPPPGTGDLLDLGCGYGPIALTMAAPRQPGARAHVAGADDLARPPGGGG